MENSMIFITKVQNPNSGLHSDFQGCVKPIWGEIMEKTDLPNFN